MSNKNFHGGRVRLPKFSRLVERDAPMKRAGVEERKIMITLQYAKKVKLAMWRREIEAALPTTPQILASAFCHAGALTGVPRHAVRDTKYYSARKLIVSFCLENSLDIPAEINRRMPGNDSPVRGEFN